MQNVQNSDCLAGDSPTAFKHASLTSSVDTSTEVSWRHFRYLRLFSNSNIWLQRMWSFPKIAGLKPHAVSVFNLKPPSSSDATIPQGYRRHKRYWVCFQDQVCDLTWCTVGITAASEIIMPLLWDSYFDCKCCNISWWCCHLEWYWDCLQTDFANILKSADRNDVLNPLLHSHYYFR
jgi:hypothetical protein